MEKRSVTTEVNDVGIERFVVYIYILYTFHELSFPIKLFAPIIEQKNRSIGWIVMYIPWDIARISRTYTHKSFFPITWNCSSQPPAKIYVGVYIQASKARLKTTVQETSLSFIDHSSLTMKFASKTRSASQPETFNAFEDVALSTIVNTEGNLDSAIRGSFSNCYFRN